MYLDVQNMLLNQLYSAAGKNIGSLFLRQLSPDIAVNLFIAQDNKDAVGTETSFTHLLDTVYLQEHINKKSFKIKQPTV